MTGMTGQSGNRVLQSVLLACVICWSVFPILWQGVTSIKPDAELMSLPPFFPTRPTLAHYAALFDEHPFQRVLLNSFGVATLTALASLALAAPAAFALAWLPARGKPVMLGIVLACSMFPAIVTVGPLFIVLRALHLRDTWWALLISHITFSLPLTIWVLTNFMRELPGDLYRAARVDGCSPWQALTDVFLPLSRPGLTAAGVLAFLFSWTEFLYAFTFTATEASRTMPVAIVLFPGLHEIRWGELAAASILVTVPVIVLVMAFQRHIVRGLTAGAVKG
jgi:trehalose/maltose transport system permease protein